MKNIFLSASVPLINREYFDTANPFLIQFAVREFLTACLGRFRVVWGGHPAITPMVWAVCEDLGVEYAQSVILYQSKYFQEHFPEENKRFGNVNYIDPVDNDQDKSLLKMRREMLGLDYEAAVFIGGMKGIFDEYNLFKELHPNVKVLPVYSPGGAAMQLAVDLKQPIDRIDYANMFYEFLGIEGTERRNVNKQKNGI